MSHFGLVCFALIFYHLSEVKYNVKPFYGNFEELRGRLGLLLYIIENPRKLVNLVLLAVHSTTHPPGNDGHHSSCETANERTESNAPLCKEHPHK